MKYIYELHFQWNDGCTLVLFSICFFVLFLAVMYSYNWFSNKIKSQKISKYLKYKMIISIFSSIFIVIIIVSSILFIFINGIFYFVDFYTGNYESVEGEVYNFKNDTIHSVETESFYIDGVKFEYSDNSNYGYRKFSTKGGVIKENGQWLKVGYIPSGDNNIIVSIAVPLAKNEEYKHIPPIYNFFIKLSIVLVIFLFLLLYIVISGRRKISIDKSRSYYLETIINKNIVEINCVICFKNTYNSSKYVKLKGYFKEEKRCRLIDDYKLYGTDTKTGMDLFNIPVGSSKFYIRFNGELNSHFANDNCTYVRGPLLPKLKLEKGIRYKTDGICHDT